MIGIIGGTGIYELVEQGRSVEEKVLDTPYGKSPKMSGHLWRFSIGSIQHLLFNTSSLFH